MPLIHSNYGFQLEFFSSVDVCGRLTYVVQVKVQTEVHWSVSAAVAKIIMHYMHGSFYDETTWALERGVKLLDGNLRKVSGTGRIWR